MHDGWLLPRDKPEFVHPRLHFVILPRLAQKQFDQIDYKGTVGSERLGPPRKIDSVKTVTSSFPATPRGAKTNRRDPRRSVWGD